jgi:hypothetical protein
MRELFFIPHAKLVGSGSKNVEAGKEVSATNASNSFVTGHGQKAVTTKFNRRLHFHRIRP